MKNRNQFILFIIAASLVFSGCKKLQDGFDYNPSYYSTELKMSVLDFMQSRKDIFSGMLAAIEYVDQDPNFKDVKQMYSSTGNISKGFCCKASALSCVERNAYIQYARFKAEMGGNICDECNK